MCPASVDHLIQRSEFLTSYTPYQPEIAQGTLHYLFEFQTQVALLTGMEVANASMYDGSTATAEAVLMAHRITKRKKAVLAGNLHPHYRETVETVSGMSDHAVVALPPSPQGADDMLGAIDKETSCVVVQTPDVYGHVHDLRPIAEKAHAAGALLIAVVTEIVSLGLVIPPGEMGADIVVGEGQSIGNGLNFGGPYVGLFASRTKYVRQMPGRLAGETVDAEGKRGFVLTLSTREQHIRREKATSNICTNSGLCTLAFSIHLRLLGEAGLRRLAQVNHANALLLAEMLGAVPGVDLLNSTFFNEFTIRVRGDAADGRRKARGAGRSRRRARLAARSVAAGAARSHHRGLDRGEHRRGPRRLCQGAPRGAGMNRQGRPTEPVEALSIAPETFTGNRALRIEEALIFETGRTDVTGVDIEEPKRAPRLGNLERKEIGLPGLSEPEAVRHYVRLSRMNYGIDSGVFPLGSCTMKHNPRLNEKMARLPGFGDIHPLQPQSTVPGRARPDRGAFALAVRAHRHAGGRAHAEGRRARRALRHDGDQGGAHRSRREALGRAGAGVGARHKPGDGRAARLSRRIHPGARATARSIPRR